MKTKTIAFVALMAALANVLAYLAVPLQAGSFQLSIHFFQVAIFLCAILAGSWAGLASGIIGSLYMTITRIPFIVGGIAILGACTGLFAKRFRPVIACLLAFLVQAPYVIITDYVWFAYFAGMPSPAIWPTLTTIMVTLTTEAVICAVLADVIVHYVKKTGFKF